MAKKTYQERDLKFETLQLHVGQEDYDPVTDARAVPIYHRHHKTDGKSSLLPGSDPDGKKNRADGSPAVKSNGTFCGLGSTIGFLDEYN